MSSMEAFGRPARGAAGRLYHVASAIFGRT